MKLVRPLILLMLLALNANAQYITAYLTVTSAPLNGATITVNGNVLTWTTQPVATPATQIGVTNTVGWSVTNLFAQLGTHVPVYGNLTRTNGTSISLAGLGLTIATSGGWATVTFFTNTTTSVLRIATPFASALPGATGTNAASQLVSDLDLNSTNALSSTSPVLTNHVAITTTQTITGNKTFNGVTTLSNANQLITGGTVSNVVVTNITRLSGLGGGGVLTNGIFQDPVATNLVNYGNPIRSPGHGTGSEQFGLGSSANGTGAAAFGDGAGALAAGAIAIGINSGANIISGTESIAIGDTAGAAANGSIAIGNLATVNSAGAIAIGQNAGSVFASSAAIGTGAATTAAHQIVLGTGAEYVSIPGGLSVLGSITNIAATGTNSYDGDISFSRKDNASLANGNNAAVSCFTNSFLKVSGPSGVFSICGIAGGRSGKILMIQNSTGFTMTIANASGVDPTAANRILTGTGADVALANNPGFCTLIYDASALRWVVVSTH